MVFFGGLLCETFILYPNVFHERPSLPSTQRWRSWLSEVPATSWRLPVCFGVLTGVGSLIFGWRVKSMRSGILASVVIILVGEILFSVAYFWPRNTIMFVREQRSIRLPHSSRRLKSFRQDIG